MKFVKDLLYFRRSLYILWILQALFSFKCFSCLEPDFSAPLMNISIAVGREATFHCYVKYLGGHRVGWIKADTKAIQAIHDTVITHNNRIGVSRSSADVWNLHIKSVNLMDSGGYICQINTDPMKAIIGYLNVLEPPDFILEESSTDVLVTEGEEVQLVCRASGRPKPHVTWRREDGQEIMMKDSSGGRHTVPTYQGEILMLNKATREAMGTYLCIASNGVPPSISKRTYLNVLFHPSIQVPNQLVGAPLGTDVTLECIIQASPKPIAYWIKDTGDMVVTSAKYTTSEYNKLAYETRARLIVHNLSKVDVGTYRCIAKNSIGEVDSSIRLYEIPGMTLMQITSTPTEEIITESNVIPKTDPIGFIYSNPTKTITLEDNMVLTSYETRKPIVGPRVILHDNISQFSVSNKLSANYVMLNFTIWLFLLKINFIYLLC